MQRVLIIGICGAGKSWLAQKMGRVLDLPVWHLDQLFWQSGWVESTPEEWHPKLFEVLATDRWIIDGNYTTTLPLRLGRADTVISLEFSRWRALTGAIQRSLTSLGQVRDDMAPGCPEKIDLEFYRYIWNFPKLQARRNEGILSESSHQEIIRLRNRGEVNRFCARLREQNTASADRQGVDR